MKTTLRESHHSISIKMVDEKKTSISIKLGYGGAGVSASAIPGKEPELNTYVNGIHKIVNKRIQGDLCGCKNYGEFAKLLVKTVEPKTTWLEVISAITHMEKA